jgi:hypothetical protein
MPNSVREALKSRGQLNTVSTELTPEIIASSDVLYCTRVQKERFPDEASYEKVKDSFVIDNKVLKQAKTNMIVMHPLPRNNEIHEEVDFDPRAAYFRQVSNLAVTTTSNTDNITDEVRIVHSHGAACYGHGSLSVCRIAYHIPLYFVFHFRRFTKSTKPTRRLFRYIL